MKEEDGIRKKKGPKIFQIKRRIGNQLLLTCRNRRRFASCSCRWPADDEASSNNSFQSDVMAFVVVFVVLLAKSFLVDRHRYHRHRYLSSCSCPSCLFPNYTTGPISNPSVIWLLLVERRIYLSGPAGKRRIIHHPSSSQINS